jgi:hypothetical protein
MEINENFGTLYTIRFETFRYQNPSFSRTQNSPFIYTLSGGCVGFSRIFINDDFHLSFNHGFTVSDGHFTYSDLNQEWIKNSGSKKYDLSKYKYIWVGSYSSINVTEA